MIEIGKVRKPKVNISESQLLNMSLHEEIVFDISKEGTARVVTRVFKGRIYSTIIINSSILRADCIISEVFVPMK